VTCDGEPVSNGTIAMCDDGRTHIVEIVLS
jgi:hypothetical protein